MSRPTIQTSTSTLRDVFEARATMCPGRRAIFSTESGWISYASLDSVANGLAADLNRLGVGRGDRVAILLPRSAPAIEAILAVWKVGASYIPVDPRGPTTQRDYVLNDAGPVIAIGDRRLGGELPSSVRCYDLSQADARPAPGNWTSEPICGDDDAWVFYTSGSTGRPKGVIGPHLASLARCEWMWRAQPFRSGEVSVQNTALTVVDSVWEVFGAIGAGIPVVLPDADAAHQPDALVDFLAKHRVSRICVVPSILRLLLDGDVPLGVRLPNLRLWVCSGATLDRSTVQRFYRDHAEAVLYNQYGLTESCADVTSFDTRLLNTQTMDVDAAVPIGHPMPHVFVHVVDDQLRPVADGEPGELCLTGDAVAAGYTVEPSHAAPRFLPNPFAYGGPVLFRTGDVVRTREDGTILHLGRVDRQVKVRGYRVEPEQIEAALSGAPDVYAVAVVAVSQTEDGAHLAAYVVPRGGRELNLDALRAHIAGLLPAHMIPGSITAMSGFPLTPSGKIDYARLPVPRPEVSTNVTWSPDPTERTLQTAFASFLKRGAPALDDDFFALGGHSLLAIRMLAKVKSEFGLDIPMRAFMTQPTVRWLSTHIGQGTSPLARAHLPDSMPDGLPTIQSLIWTHHNLAAVSGLYNVVVAFRLAGEVDVPALQTALDATVRRHRALRTSFAGASGTLTATVYPYRSWPLQVHSIDADGSFAEHIESELETGFDLSTAPLVRARLVAIGAGEHALILCAHHIVCDGYSLGLLLEGVATGYSLAKMEPESERAPVDPAAPTEVYPIANCFDLPPSDAVVEACPLVLPTDRHRPASTTGRGAAFDFVIGEAMTARVRQRAGQAGVTPFEVSCAAFAIVMAGYSGQERFDISVPLANRTTPRSWSEIGCFMHLARLRIDMSGDPTDTELIHRIRHNLWDGRHREADEDRPPNVTFAFDQAHCEDFGLAGLAVAPISVPGRFAKVDLAMYLEDAPDHVLGRIEYADAIFDRWRIEALARHFCNVLDNMCDGNPATASRIPLLDQEELELIERFGRATETWQSLGVCLHELLAEQMAAHPGSPVVAGSSRWTHRQLGELSDSAARVLRARGVRPGHVVGIHLQRSFQYLIAVFAVLKAGGAFLPLDPGQPQARLRDFVADAGARVVVSDSTGSDWPSGTALVDLAELSAVVAGAALPKTPPGSAAYVVFTSGSTGRPKGVVVSHNAIVNQLLWMQKTFALDASDCVMFKTPVCFDVSLWDVFLPFLTGATMQIAATGAHRDLDDVIDTIVAAGVTTIQFVPSVLHLFARHPRVGECTTLKRIFAIGEALAPDMVTQVARVLDAELHNLYGPTETTVAVTWAPCPRSELQSWIPIGRFIANSHGRVVDRRLRPVPIGVWGELCVGGLQVADGYIDRPGLTAEKFVAHPSVSGARMYRTGDLVRWNREGQLEFHGRVDRQVKIAGWRIEPGEVEAALRKSDLVGDAVVEPDDPQAPTGLVAYVVPGAAGSPTPEELRTVLRHQLPPALQPSRFVIVPDLPRLPNQKVDRRALASAAPRQPAVRSDRNLSSDSDEVTAAVRGVWESVFRCDIDVDDNFLELGGDSMAAIRIVIELNRVLGWSLTPDAVMRAPIFQEFVGALMSGSSQRTEWRIDYRTATHQVRQSNVSALQQRWLELDERGYGHIPYLVEVQGPLRADLFATTVDALRERHAVLRSTFVAGKPPQQHVLDVESVVRQHLLRSGRDGMEPSFDVRQAIARSQRRFDVSVEPPFDMELVCAGSDRFFLVGRIHHLVGDGWAITLIVEDFERVHAAIVGGVDPAKLPPAAQYSHFATAHNAYLAGERVLPARAYWQRLFTDSEGPTSLPSRVRPGPELPRFVNAVLSPEYTSKLQSFAICRSATLFSVLVTAFARMLADACGSDDLVFGTSFAGRHHPRTDQTIGVFVNPLPVRVRLRRGQRFDDAHADVHRTLLDVNRWQDYAMSDLVGHVEPFVGWNVNDTYNVQIVFQNYPAPMTAGPRRYRVINNQDIEAVRTFDGLDEPHRLLREFELIAIRRADGSLALNFGYQSTLFTEAQVRRWAAVYLDELEFACAATERQAAIR